MAIEFGSVFLEMVLGLFSSECSQCGSVDHATVDCPHGFFSSECGQCGSKEHGTADCPHGFFSSECSQCGSKNHATAECPQGFFSSECAQCGSREHATGDCPHGFFSSECSACGSKNHATVDCPHGWASSSSKPIEDNDNYELPIKTDEDYENESNYTSDATIYSSSVDSNFNDSKIYKESSSLSFAIKIFILGVAIYLGGKFMFAEHLSTNPIQKMLPQELRLSSTGLGKATFGMTLQQVEATLGVKFPLNAIQQKNWQEHLCYVITPQLLNVGFIFNNGRLQAIDVGEGSIIKTRSGIAVGDSESKAMDILKTDPTYFRQENQYGDRSNTNMEITVGKAIFNNSLNLYDGTMVKISSSKGKIVSIEAGDSNYVTMVEHEDSGECM